MNPNEYLRMSIHEPAKVQPTRSLGVFYRTPLETIVRIVSTFLSGIPAVAESRDAIVKEECERAIKEGKILLVRKEANILTFVVELPNAKIDASPGPSS